ncbi:hypothetical protein C0J52_05968 [Blattella germanica]|nr:hypothetical protein C0J52_05968 [Blattella germanica]
MSVSVVSELVRTPFRLPFHSTVRIVSLHRMCIVSVKYNMWSWQQSIYSPHSSNEGGFLRVDNFLLETETKNLNFNVMKEPSPSRGHINSLGRRLGRMMTRPGRRLVMRRTVLPWHDAWGCWRRWGLMVRVARKLVSGGGCGRRSSAGHGVTSGGGGRSWVVFPVKVSAESQEFVIKFPFASPTIIILSPSSVLLGQTKKQLEASWLQILRKLYTHDIRAKLQAGFVVIIQKWNMLKIMKFSHEILPLNDPDWNICVERDVLLLFSGFERKMDYKSVSVPDVGHLKVRGVDEGLPVVQGQNVKRRGEARRYKIIFFVVAALGCVTVLRDNMVQRQVKELTKYLKVLGYKQSIKVFFLDRSCCEEDTFSLRRHEGTLTQATRPQQWKDKTIHRWYTQFKETFCLCKNKSTGRLSTSPGDVKSVRQLYQRSPQKSTHRASRELSISQPTVWRVLCKRLRFRPYRLQLLQDLGPADYINRAEFCIDFQNKLKDDNDNFAASTMLNTIESAWSCLKAAVKRNLSMHLPQILAGEDRMGIDSSSEEEDDGEGQEQLDDKRLIVISDE